MLAIFKKELRSYFLNAIGYVYVGVFLTAAAILCCYTTLGSQSYDTDSYFTFLIFSFIILIPLLTMKSFAEEKRNIEFLLKERRKEEEIARRVEWAKEQKLRVQERNWQTAKEAKERDYVLWYEK